MQGLFCLSLAFIGIGAAGFTRKGLPLTAHWRIMGPSGAILGGVCLAIGILGASACYWASAPTDQHEIRLLCRGLVLGVIGTTWIFWRPD